MYTDKAGKDTFSFKILFILRNRVFPPISVSKYVKSSAIEALQYEPVFPKGTQEGKEYLLKLAAVRL